MTKRKGLGKGKGKGFKNIIGADPNTHSMSARGIKQPQRMPENVKRFIEQNPTLVRRALSKKEDKKIMLKDIEFNDDAIEIEDYKGGMIRIFQDDNPIDPREWDNLGHMACTHQRYNLGDENDKINPDEFNGWDEIEDYLIEEKSAVVVLPLYLYDHSGITMSVADFGDRWDSGRVGYIYITQGELAKEAKSWSKEWKNKYHKGKNNQEIAREILQGEVKTYDQYLTGDVYGYKALNEQGEELESMWGFFGMKSAIEEGKANIDFDLKNRRKK